ncbi:MAG: hypothetical protein ACT4OX_11320 [Actinomycetota bacterium]
MATLSPATVARAIAVTVTSVASPDPAYGPSPSPLHAAATRTSGQLPATARRRPKGAMVARDRHWPGGGLHA